MFTEVVATAPGKVILHGEHSVVYGKLAIAVSINLRTKVCIRPMPDALPLRVKVNFRDLRRSYNFNLDDLFGLVQMRSLNGIVNSKEDIAHHETLDLDVVNQIRKLVIVEYPEAVDDNGLLALLYLLATSNLRNQGLQTGLDIYVTSEIPIGAGLGSSAAFSVAVAAAIKRLTTVISKSKIENGHKSANGLCLTFINGHNHDIKVFSSQFDDETSKKQKLDNNNDPYVSNGFNHAWQSFNPDDQNIICRTAFLAEKILHGNPSGIDNSVCTFGGLLTYQSTVGMKPLAAPKNLRILLINTKVSRNTKAMVERVRQRAIRLPKVVARILETMDQLSYSCLETMRALKTLHGDDFTGKNRNYETEEDDYFGTLEALIDTNQGLLSALGVSHPAIERAIQISGRHSLHTKLTGAGGGGFAFSLLSPRRTETKAARMDLEKAGYECWETEIGGAGVQFLAACT